MLIIYQAEWCPYSSAVRRAHRAQYRAHAEARRNEVTGRIREDVPLTRAR